MPKKINNKKRSPLVTISIIAIILLALILCGTHLYILEIENAGVSNFIFSIRENNKIKDKPVKDMITYTLPSGWTEDDKVSYLRDANAVLLKSSDYVDIMTAENPADRDGAHITLDISPKYKFLTITELKWWYSRGDSSDYINVKIDNVPGLKWEDSYTYHRYIFIKGEYMLSIDASIYAENMSAEEENQYWKDMNSIIDSIQFK